MKIEIELHPGRNAQPRWVFHRGLIFGLSVVHTAIFSNLFSDFCSNWYNKRIIFCFVQFWDWFTLMKVTTFFESFKSDIINPFLQHKKGLSGNSNPYKELKHNWRQNDIIYGTAWLTRPFSLKTTFVHCFMQLGLGVIKDKRPRQFHLKAGFGSGPFLARAVCKCGISLVRALPQK